MEIVVTKDPEVIAQLWADTQAILLERRVDRHGLPTREEVWIVPAEWQHAQRGRKDARR